LSGYNEDVTCVSFSPDSRYLMSGCVEGHFRIWSVHPTKLVVSEMNTIVQDNAHEIGITSAHFAFKSKLLYTTNRFKLRTRRANTLAKREVIEDLKTYN